MGGQNDWSGSLPGSPGVCVLGVVLALSCGPPEGTRFVGEATAVVDPHGRPGERRTSRSTDEVVIVRTAEGGRLELQLDECSFTTEPAVGDRASVRPGERCRAGRSGQTAEVVVRAGEVTRDEGAGTLTVVLQGDGRAGRGVDSIAVRYEYRFTGSER